MVEESCPESVEFYHNDYRPVLLMAQDEGRFGCLGQVMKAWCPSGHRPIVAKQGVRDYVYAYAAVAPALGKMASLVLPPKKQNQSQRVRD